MRKMLAAVLTLCLVLGSIFSFTGMPEKAHAANTIYWGDSHSATYEPIHPYILNWSGNIMDQGGLNLTTMKITSKSSDADLIINQYGDVGALSIIKLEDEELEAPTEEPLKGFTNSYEIARGDVYLLVLHDGTYAKLRIDRILPDSGYSITKVMFSYVLEAPAPEEPEPNTPPSGPGTGELDLGSPEEDALHPYAEFEFPEDSSITIPWNVVEGDAAWDIYRSDNGLPYVKMTDFRITEPKYIDNYTLVGHVYLYKLVAYNAAGKAVYVSPAIKITIVPKGTGGTEGTSGGNGGGTTNRIVLQIDNKQASVNGKLQTLSVAPLIYDGRTLVPLRFISEALGAKVDWNDAKRSITLTLGSETIVPVIDSSLAVVNGESVNLDVPAKIFDGSTMVPVRFISEHFGQTITFDNETYVITIEGPGLGGSGQSGSQTPAVTPADYYIGQWEMWVPAGSKGASGGILTIKKDGSISFDWNGPQEGTWTYDKTAGTLLLKDYKSGWDWTVTKTEDGIKVSSFGVYETGTRVQ